MKTIDNIAGVRAEIKKGGGKLGFVPTMGALHEGHASLIKAAVKDCDRTVLSIFVNPLQFGPAEDFEKYPKDTDTDKQLAQELGVDILFTPGMDEMYPSELNSYVGVGELAARLCGRFRPSHFEGVATIVAKFFNIIEPDVAYFGQKDYQQYLVLRKMCEDLNFDIELELMPIIREEDGLAMSSRNKYLSPEERQAALSLYRALTIARQEAESGNNKTKKVVELAKNELYKEDLIYLEYFEAVDPETLEPKKDLTGDILFAVAAFSGKDTRLIDNILVKNYKPSS